MNPFYIVDTLLFDVFISDVISPRRKLVMTGKKAKIAKIVEDQRARETGVQAKGQAFHSLEMKRESEPSKRLEIE